MIISSGVTAYLIITNILICNNIFYDTRFLYNDANTVGLLLRSFGCRCGNPEQFGLDGCDGSDLEGKQGKRSRITMAILW